MQPPCAWPTALLWAAILAPEPVAALDAGGRSLNNPYTVFVVSALIVAGWLAVFALVTAGRDNE